MELDRKKQNRQTTGEAGTLYMHRWPRCDARTEQEVKKKSFFKPLVQRILQHCVKLQRYFCAKDSLSTRLSISIEMSG